MYHIAFDIELQHHDYPGKYIALEGIDGSGKSTQVDFVRDYFEKEGRKVTVIKFPRKDEGLLSDITKNTLLGKTSIPKPAFQYLFSADYIMLTEEIIIPALKRGDVVVSDRFHCWSSVAYGLWENNPNYDTRLAQSQLVISTLLSQGYQSFVPDMTFYLSVDVGMAAMRLRHMDKEQELYEKQDVLQKIMKGYGWLLEAFPGQFSVIDAKKPIAEVTADIVQRIKADE